MLGLVLLFAAQATLQPWDVDSAFIDRNKLQAATSTCTALEVERDMIASERTFWKQKAGAVGEAALTYRDQRDETQRILQREQTAHHRTKAQLDALLTAPVKRETTEDSVNVSFVPDWILPAAIGLGAGLAVGIGLGIIVGD